MYSLSYPDNEVILHNYILDNGGIYVQVSLTSQWNTHSGIIYSLWSMELWLYRTYNNAFVRHISNEVFYPLQDKQLLSFHDRALRIRTELNQKFLAQERKLHIFNTLNIITCPKLHYPMIV